MKKIITVILILMIFLTGCSTDMNNNSGAPSDYIPQGEYPGIFSKTYLDNSNTNTNNNNNNSADSRCNYDYVKGIWVSYINLGISGMSAEEYTEYITTMMTNIADFGFNTVFFHVRPYGDALYKSSIFPWSHILSGQQGKDPGYDPLAIAVDIAHQKNLSIHAWVNPFRIQTSNEISRVPVTLSENNPAIKWQNDGNADNNNYIIKIGDSWYYNPGVPEVRNLLIDGVKEIVSNYKVDGVQFDDYFYPSTDETIDKISYDNYINNGGTLNLGDWRRDNINTFVADTYKAIKEINPNVRFGISPSADIIKNRDQLYADVSLWVKGEGYVDYICPQIYFGFENQTKPFESTLREWINLTNGTKTLLYIGLAGYKTGESDQFAGSGKDEWLNNSDILARQINMINGETAVDGFAIYDYASIFSTDASEIRQKERDNIKGLLKPAV